MQRNLIIEAQSRNKKSIVNTKLLHSNQDTGATEFSPNDYAQPKGLGAAQFRVNIPATAGKQISKHN